MKSAVLRVLIVFVILAALCAAQTVIAGDKPKLPLQPGLYLPEGVECPKSSTTVVQPPLNSISCGMAEGQYIFDIKGYEFMGIEDIRKNKYIYYMKIMSKIGLEQVAIKILSEKSFSIISAMDIKKGTVYRYCGNPDDFK